MKQPQRGFTLVEAMITIAIMAVVAVIAAPSLTTLMVTNTIRSASADLSTDTVLARSEALRLRTAITVCASSDGASCNGAAWNQGWLVIDATNNTLIRTHGGISNGFTITPSTGGTSMMFTQAAYPNTPVTWTICKTGYTGSMISVNAAGRISTTPTSSPC